ncbi:MAG: flagellar motor protein MotB, partial [Candidatus Eremiobacterota bacterium]
MSQNDPAPIIVKKVVRGGHGHHGGSWKVAYADFVTAMMALFIVLWVLAQNEKTRNAVAMYFTDPSMTPEQIKLKLDNPAIPNAEEKPETPEEKKIYASYEQEKQRLAEL